MMRQPRFWSKDGNRLMRWLLAPLGWIYGGLTLRRVAKPGWRAPVPVISIGNFTVGGGGKTPTAMAMAHALSARGDAPVLITRGYGGQLAGPVRVVPGQHRAAETGDEPLLLAAVAPTIVARDRRAGAMMALEHGAGCLILDDALQNPDLIKDLSLAVVDAGFGFGNGACLPAGPLRAPVAAMARHVDAILLIGAGNKPEGFPAKLPCFRATLEPQRPASLPAGAAVLAYCGLARPEKFATSLRALGLDLRGLREFPDHHPFTAAEAEALLAEAEQLGAALVTTEKDAARFAGEPAFARLAAASHAIPVRLQAEAAFWDWLYAGLSSVRSRASTASGPA